MKRSRTIKFVRTHKPFGIHAETKKQTSGIPGGYRLVSTYDLPDCKTILKFEILKFSDWGEGYSG